MHDRKVRPCLNPEEAGVRQRSRSGGFRSAEAHGEPMSGRAPLFIVTTWAWAIRYRPSLFRRAALPFLSCALFPKFPVFPAWQDLRGGLRSPHERFSPRSTLPGRCSTSPTTGRFNRCLSDRSLNKNVSVSNDEISPKMDARNTYRGCGACHPGMQLVACGVSHRSLLDFPTSDTSVVWPFKVSF
jgi:hypothetical protein